MLAANHDVYLLPGVARKEKPTAKILASITHGIKHRSLGIQANIRRSRNDPMPEIPAASNFWATIQTFWALALTGSFIVWRSKEDKMPANSSQ